MFSYHLFAQKHFCVVLITPLIFDETLYFSFSIAMEPIVLVHGGAGEIPDIRGQKKIRGCKIAARTGYDVLKKGGSALDAVEAAVRVMEDDEAFNAGLFTVYNYITDKRHFIQYVVIFQ